MSRYAWPAVWLVLAWVGLPVGAAHAFLDLHRVTGQPVDTHYRVMDSGLHTTEDENIYWIDNRQVIFWGFRLTDDGGLLDGPHDRGIYIWDTETGNIRWYNEQGAALCYHDGYINYTHTFTKPKPTGYKYRHNWREGPIGHEKQYVLDFKDDQEADRWGRAHYTNKLTCQILLSPRGVDRRHWIPLLPRDGYLDGGSRGRSSYEADVTWHRPNGEVIPLPLKRKDVMTVQYYPFKKAYLFWRGGYVDDSRWEALWKRDGCTPGTWFYPNGRMEKFCIPYIDWGGHGAFRVYATRPGLLMLSDSSGRGGYAGTSGLYLITGGETYRLVSGWVTGVGISPDGCRVAMLHAPDARSIWKTHGVKQTVKAVELCARKGEKRERRIGPRRFANLGVDLEISKGHR